MKKYLYNGFHKIEEVVTELKGKQVKREKLLIKSAVGGCVIDEKGRIALVTQFRPTANFLAKEIPAGVLDKDGLTPTEVLIEELLEECEIQHEDVISVDEVPFHEYFLIIGSSDAKITLHEIHVKEQAQQFKKVEDADVDSVEWVTLETFEQYINEGLIQDPKTLLSYYHAKAKADRELSIKEEIDVIVDENLSDLDIDMEQVHKDVELDELALITIPLSIYTAIADQLKTKGIENEVVDNKINQLESSLAELIALRGTIL